MKFETTLPYLSIDIGTVDLAQQVKTVSSKELRRY
jgi:hypothetical protein